MKNLKRMIACTLTGAMILTTPVSQVSASQKNEALEIWANFAESQGAMEQSSEVVAMLWDLSNTGKLSQSYETQFKLYIPVTLMKNDAVISCSSSIQIYNANNNNKFAGQMKLPGFELNANQLTVNLAKENDEYEISKYATAKRKGDFYVVQYKGTSNTYFGEKLEDIYFGINVQMDGKHIDTNGKPYAIYLDDLVFTDPSGNKVLDKNFSAGQQLDGQSLIQNTREPFTTMGVTVATIVNNKALSVTPSKITVKKGKKAKISMVGKSNVGNLGMVYRSSNKKVASVSSTGVVTGKKAGKAVITVEFNGKKVKVPVVVTK